ncbi:hypothetical protein C8R46DRAFT_1037831 [Mycena filopes]|nr:hypothetical protein C8R46DRAFT_1037828 [Mycena filopes]KAJ7161629.1 hypothetical protein C8R46DRAFT_1037831 [Mycena filopes]
MDFPPLNLDRNFNFGQGFEETLVGANFDCAFEGAPTDFFPLNSHGTDNVDSVAVNHTIRKVWDYSLENVTLHALSERISAVEQTVHTLERHAFSESHVDGVTMDFDFRFNSQGTHEVDSVAANIRGGTNRAYVREASTFKGRLCIEVLLYGKVSAQIVPVLQLGVLIRVALEVKALGSVKG